MEPSRLSRGGGGGPSWSAGLAAIVRAGEWWDYKLVPILTLFYATLLLLGRPIASSWLSAVALLLSLLAGAVYVSLVNDLTDIDEDRAAGKSNRMAGRSRPFRALALLLPLAVGLLFLVAWRDDPWLAAAYLSAWIAFSLYSIPPFRLKTRGLAGILADASGAHLFPTLVAILLAFRAAQQPVDPVWIAAGATFALGYGLRGILWHQLSDRDNDEVANVRTFAQRHSIRATAAIGAWIAFPLELAGLAVLLWMIASPIPLLMFAFYLVLGARRIRSSQTRVIVVRPVPHYEILMHEYYDVFLPVAILLAAALRHPIDLAVLAIHLALFSRRPARAIEDSWHLIARPILRRLQIR